ncbi:MAG: cytochrome C [Deltaproteobacteria bacterium]|nr:cytochrome C [Deltaproteobacteria bacterium]
MKHHRHLVRAGAALIGAALLFFVVRALVMPKSFGRFGHFRGDNIAEQAAIPAVHGAPEACAECHMEVAETKVAGKHASVPCQDCHGPLALHITEAGKEQMPMHRSFTLCARCHQQLAARPAAFPQIDLMEHLDVVGAGHDALTTNEAICFDCHRPHSPSPALAPGTKTKSR